jgi:hypothetical protein
MTYELPSNTSTFVSTPVVKRTAIGEKFAGAIIRFEQRDVKKKDDKTGELVSVLKPSREPGKPGKPRQEMVVHCIVLPANTAPVGLGDDTHVGVAGEEVRVILRGGGFGDWIEATKGHRGGKLNVGDVLLQKVDYAQVYDASGAKKGAKITEQSEVEKLPRSTTIGFYGTLTLHEPKDPTYIDAAEKAYVAWKSGTATELAPSVSIEEF